MSFFFCFDERSVLYGGFLEKPRPAGSKEGGKGKAAAGIPSRARLIKVNVDPMAIENLSQRLVGLMKTKKTAP